MHIAHKYNFSFEGLRRLARQGGYQVNRLTPDPKMQTHCSHMPELWVELVLNDVADEPESMSAVPARGVYGDEMLRYLRRTEKLFSLGLCRGQVLQKLSAGKNFVERNLLRLRRVTPAKVIRKLKGNT
ncbi:MAG: hypothetical protein LC775_09395 [Acidobacteria bacterium]|nr:hypothetical protein [Acidobacteriota bacterium]